MCELSGFYSLGGTIQLDNYYKAHSLLKHRGPNDKGSVVR